jgi:hypothetical protein
LHFLGTIVIIFQHALQPNGVLSSLRFGSGGNSFRAKDSFSRPVFRCEAGLL